MSLDSWLWSESCPKWLFRSYHRCAKAFGDFKYGLKYFFKNLWFYRGFLWNDRPWDHDFLYAAIKIKLENMHPEIIGFKGHVECQDEIRQCIELLDRLIANEYDVNAQKEIDRIYGEADFVETPIYSKDGKIEGYGIDIVRAGAKTEPAKHKVEQMMHEAWETAERKRQADLDQLCEIIAKKSRGWWS